MICIFTDLFFLCYRFNECGPGRVFAGLDHGSCYKSFRKSFASSVILERADERVPVRWLQAAVGTVGNFPGCPGVGGPWRRSCSPWGFLQLLEQQPSRSSHSLGLAGSVPLFSRRRRAAVLQSSSDEGNTRPESVWRLRRAGGRRSGPTRASRCSGLLDLSRCHPSATRLAARGRWWGFLWSPGWSDGWGAPLLRHSRCHSGKHLHKKSRARIRALLFIRVFVCLFIHAVSYFVENLFICLGLLRYLFMDALTYLFIRCLCIQLFCSFASVFGFISFFLSMFFFCLTIHLSIPPVTYLFLRFISYHFIFVLITS